MKEELQKKLREVRELREQKLLESKIKKLQEPIGKSKLEQIKLKKENLSLIKTQEKTSNFSKVKINHDQFFESFASNQEDEIKESIRNRSLVTNHRQTLNLNGNQCVFLQIISKKTKTNDFDLFEIDLPIQNDRSTQDIQMRQKLKNLRIADTPPIIDYEPEIQRNGKIVPIQKDRLTTKSARIFIPPQPLKKKPPIKPPQPKFFTLGFDIFLQRRKHVPGRQIDLAVKDLDQLLMLCLDKKLISRELVYSYLGRNGMPQIKSFLKLLVEQKINEFNFKNSTFTLIDHRRISQLLLHLYPDEFTFKEIDALHVDIKEIFKKIYSIKPDDYVKIYQVMDNLSDAKWWETLKYKYKDTPHSNYFKIKEALWDQSNIFDSVISAEEKAVYVKSLLGNFKVKNSEEEMDKLLSQRWKDSIPGFNAQRVQNQQERYSQRSSNSSEERSDDESRYVNPGNSYALGLSSQHISNLNVDKSDLYFDDDEGESDEDSSSSSASSESNPKGNKKTVKNSKIFEKKQKQLK